MSTLYEITGEYCALLDYADSTDSEDEQVFLDTLESITGELEIKADNYAAVITEINATIDKFNAEIKRLTAKKEAMENNVKRMKTALLESMQQMGIPEIQGQHFKLKIQNNGGLKPLKITGDVPNNYKRIVYEDDKEKIRKDLEAGKKLEFAHLEERGQHLRIK